MARDKPDGWGSACRLQGQCAVVAVAECGVGSACGRIRPGEGGSGDGKVFVNTVLGLPWSEQGDGIDETALARRIEPIGLDAIPEECLALSAGTDCADDRLETVICGWTRDNVCLVLDHIVILGAIGDDLTWQQLDQLLRRQFSHPLGGKLRIEACAIDFGDGGHADIVLGFAAPRASRRVMAIKARPVSPGARCRLLRAR